MSKVENCYEYYINKTKPKGLFNRLRYYIWLQVGCLASGLFTYTIGKAIKEMKENGKD
jgi:hypothetical protein